MVNSGGGGGGTSGPRPSQSGAPTATLRQIVIIGSDDGSLLNTILPIDGYEVYMKQKHKEKAVKRGNVEKRRTIAEVNGQFNEQAQFTTFKQFCDDTAKIANRRPPQQSACGEFPRAPEGSSRKISKWDLTTRVDARPGNLQKGAEPEFSKEK